MDEKEYNRIIENIEKEREYEWSEGILYRKKERKRLQVIRRWEMEGVMYLMHDHPLSAHFGIGATYEKMKERYYWKGMRKDIEIYVKSCDKCQRREKPKGKHELHPIEVKEPFHMIGIDFVGPLP
jgi:His(2)-Cys(2) zinc finger.